MDNRINRLERMGLNSARLDHLLGHADVRPARQEDAEAISAIYNETAMNGRTSPTSEPQSVEGMRYFIARQNKTNWPIYVFMAGDQVAGYVYLQPFSFEPQACEKTAELNVYIGNAWRNVGLGIHMAGFAATLADHIGCINGMCWIMDVNQLSRRLARAASCVEWGHFPKLARSADTLVDVKAVGNRLDNFFASSWGRRILRRQDDAWREYDEHAAAVAAAENPTAAPTPAPSITEQPS